MIFSSCIVSGSEFNRGSRTEFHLWWRSLPSLPLLNILAMWFHYGPSKFTSFTNNLSSSGVHILCDFYAFIDHFEGYVAPNSDNYPFSESVSRKCSYFVDSSMVLTIGYCRVSGAISVFLYSFMLMKKLSLRILLMQA